MESQTAQFVIAKSFDGYPSKNLPKYHQEKSWAAAVDWLDLTESQWKRNSGIVVSRTESKLVVQEQNGETTIIFEIKEA